MDREGRWARFARAGVRLLALGCAKILVGCSHPVVVPSEQFVPTGLPAEARIVGIEFSDPAVPGPIRYYVRNPAQRARHAVVFIGGSGCTAAFVSDGTRAKASIEIVPLKESPEFLVAVIDKPGVPRQSRGGGTSEGCPQAFLDAYDFDTRLRYVRLAIEHVAATYRPDDIQVIGTSEGALLAAAAAGTVPSISMVTLVSGFGDQEIYDTLSPPSNEVLVRSLRAWEGIVAAPGRTEPLVFGHPPRRWASWLGRSPAASLAKAPKRTTIYIAQGLQDTNHSPQSFVAGLATLVAARRSFWLSMVDCGDHFLMCASDPPGEPNNLFAVVRTALAIQAGVAPSAGVQRFSFDAN